MLVRSHVTDLPSSLRGWRVVSPRNCPCQGQLPLPASEVRAPSNYFDATTYAEVTVLLTLAAIIATAIPARAATRVSPASVLRSD